MTRTPDQQRKKAAAYNRGIITLLVLAVLTIVELGVSTATSGSAVLLLIIAVAKAGLILWIFMHIASLWNEEAH
ncbi:MAG: cytochrome C oxidase subunit IV family protein [Anaerolineales bacterium]